MSAPLPPPPPPPPPAPYGGYASPPPYGVPPPGWGAAPSPPPERTSPVLIVVVVVVVVILAIAAIGAYLFFVSFKTVNSFTQSTVNGASWDINYAGNTTGFFGLPNQSGCSSCPMTGLVGSEFSLSHTFVNSATAQSHAITDISVALPFALVTTTPSLPIQVLAGGSVTVTVTATYPVTSGTYTLTVILTVS
ncbi:MAG TPA: hypothetical protein VFG07_09545 [Thermoplasmata archaeon]|nr:hypothetical protein [Thermoplasmata archaeon]